VDESLRIPPGTKIYVRHLKSYNFTKAHLRAIAALKSSEDHFNNGSPVTSDLLRGRISDAKICKLSDIDEWRLSKCSSSQEQSGAQHNVPVLPDEPNARNEVPYRSNAKHGNSIALTGSDICKRINLSKFNDQQQRALGLDALTPDGVVMIQGPPGTGKSHVICHGLIPQAVARSEKVLVVCNSNVAVDSLLLKCVEGSKSLTGKMIRVGFKDKVSSEVVALGLYAEGDLRASSRDQYGNTSGSNSNTSDSGVQNQIRSSQVLFTTIHFASKEKDKNQSADASYWNFDTLILDEAAQIEDSKLFIVLARCPSLKKIVLVCDPKQIQPYVPEYIRRQDSGSSTMERLMDSHFKKPDETIAPYIMLQQQFRMAPSLRQLVSSLYYQGRLHDSDRVLNNGPDKEKVKLKPLLVINVTGTSNHFNRLHRSYENRAEAEVVKVVYDFLLGSTFEGVLPDGISLTPKDVCILTPFNRHKDRLRMTVCNLEEDDIDRYSGQVFRDNMAIEEGRRNLRLCWVRKTTSTKTSRRESRTSTLWTSSKAASGKRSSSRRASTRTRSARPIRILSTWRVRGRNTSWSSWGTFPKASHPTKIGRTFETKRSCTGRTCNTA